MPKDDNDASTKLTEAVSRVTGLCRFLSHTTRCQAARGPSFLRRGVHQESGVCEGREENLLFAAVSSAHTHTHTHTYADGCRKHVVLNNYCSY